MPQGDAAQIIRGLLGCNVIAGFILYVTYYRHLQGVLTLLRDLTPPLLFIAGAVLIYSHDKTIVRRRRLSGEEEAVVVLTAWDALVNDVLACLTAAVIVALPGLLDGRGLNFIDLLQGAAAFAAIMWLRHHYFRKTKG